MNDNAIGFVVDTQMGRLAKWLRIIGSDAHYQSRYRNYEIEILNKKGRILLTRNRELYKHFRLSLLIHSEKINQQLNQLKKSGFLPETDKHRFKRCIICNIPLQSVKTENARGRIPEYIISQNIEGIKYCPSCERYFRPGSHRTRIIRQMELWGL